MKQIEFLETQDERQSIEDIEFSETAARDSLQTYMDEVRQFALLSPEEERNLSTSIQHYRRQGINTLFSIPAAADILLRRIDSIVNREVPLTTLIYRQGDSSLAYQHARKQLVSASRKLRKILRPESSSKIYGRRKSRYGQTLRIENFLGMKERDRRPQKQRISDDKRSLPMPRGEITFVETVRKLRLKDDVVAAVAKETSLAIKTKNKTLSATYRDRLSMFDAAWEQLAEAKNRLAEGNLRLVIKVARRFLGKGFVLDDLVQEGNLGLLKAVERFEPDKGFRFSTYATWWIAQSINKSLKDRSRLIRLPAYVYNRMTVISKASLHLEHDLSRCPSGDEVANHTGLAAMHVQDLMAHYQAPVSLETSLGEDGAMLKELIRDSSTPDILDDLVNKDTTRAVERILGTLPQRDATIVRCHFGLDGNDNKTFDQLGSALGLTKERVRQLLSSALGEMKKSAKHRGLIG